MRISVTAVHKPLEFGVEEVRSELVLLHFLERLIRRPAVVGHAVHGGHDLRSVPPACTIQALLQCTSSRSPATMR
jgi:hypothetical protein